jgi:hypothetical protein
MTNTKKDNSFKNPSPTSFEDAKSAEVLEAELELGERLAPGQEVGRLAALVLLLAGNHFLFMLLLDALPNQCRF